MKKIAFPARLILIAAVTPFFFAPAAFAAGSEDAPPTTAKAAPPADNGSKEPAAPTTKAAPSAASYYEDGKAAISRKDWGSAITALSKAAEMEPKNADIHNLLGYSYRKTANYKNAFAHYAIALTLNPKHKGALEYQGEAYAETGDLTKAKANLAKLKSVCGTGCEEYRDLAAFIKTAESKKAPAPTKKKK
jgi:Flp pilus assembly protein TadD